MRTYLSTDELDVVWTLGIAVSRTVLCTSLVSGGLRHTAVGVHGDEIQSTVKTARQLGHVDVEGELLVAQIEHLVFRVGGVHEIDTGTDVLGVGAVGNELQSEGVSGGGNTIGAAVVCAVKSTVGSACLTVGAERRVPFVAGVAVGEVLCGVEPTPVGIEDDGALLGCAATSRATFLPAELRVTFSRIIADLLADGPSGEESERDKSCLWEHPMLPSTRGKPAL